MNAILVDVTRCTGCERCVEACMEENGAGIRVDAQVARASSRDGLSAERLVSLEAVAEGRFARMSCMHCIEPACVSACLVGSLTKTPEGPVLYDPDKCIGCRYCMLACPFHVPRYEWADTMPLVRKCDMCIDRVGEGRLPACVEACPHDALRFGDRDRLLAEARALLASSGRRYLPRIWGEHEFGGTSVLYVSDVDLTPMGWPAPDERPIPALTEPLIARTPFIGMGVMAGLLGIHWVIRRRMRLAAAGADSSIDSEPGSRS
jgi:formate dehydrogenase iron-sulfur subunit